jgi:cysteine desulfurase / selenocysteine lyase
MLNHSTQQIDRLNVEAIRRDFPIFTRTVRNGSRLIYLDSGATSQKPRSVIEAEETFYFTHNAAVHRGAHLLAEEAEASYESARNTVARFIGADPEEVIFTKSATESLNGIAYSLSNSLRIKEGDEILVTEMEHHANLIPWQQLAKRTGAALRYIPITPGGRLDLSNLDSLLTKRTKVLAFTHQSNVLGTINPVSELTERAHAVGSLVVLDACQSLPHMKIDVRRLNIDFLAFSGHKALGPTGIGVLWGRKDILNDLEPFIFGGSMIESVTMDSATWAPSPRRFEAGVPNMAGAIGLAAAIEYLNGVGMEAIGDHLNSLTAYALDKVGDMNGVAIYGPRSMESRGATISFSIDDIHPHDVGQVLDQHGIAVRTGHHCAWPLMRRFGISGTVRASLYLYNGKEDIDALVGAMVEAQRFFVAKG